MRHRPHLVLILMGGLALMACSDAPDDDNGGRPDISAIEDVTGDIVSDLDQVAGDTVKDTGSSTDDVSDLCPGGAGCPCDDSEDCDAGLCLEGINGARCAKPCVDTCDAGYVCSQVPQGSDLVAVCVDAWARLCSPCQESKDCNYPGVTNARCVDRGDLGAFCGAGCSSDADCPVAYACKDAKDIDGVKTSQCIPTNSAGAVDACSCSKNAVQLALKGLCKKSLLVGSTEVTCAGDVQCKTAGSVPECQANEPDEE